jgi:hypothetical protein
MRLANPSPASVSYEFRLHSDSRPPRMCKDHLIAGSNDAGDFGGVCEGLDT